MLAQIVIDHQNMLALMHEVFAYGAAGIGRNVLQGRLLGGGGADNDGVVHGAGALQRVYQLRHGRALLTDGHIDADDILSLLVDDGIGGQNGLAGLPVADDQLTLAASDGDHAVNGLDAGLQGLLHRLALDNAGSRTFNGRVALRHDIALAVDGTTQRVHHTADHGLAHGHRDNASRAAHGVTLADAHVAAQQNDGHGVLLQIQRHAVFAVGEFHQLVDLTLVKAGHTGDTVAHQNDAACLIVLNGAFIVLDLGADDLGYFF